MINFYSPGFVRLVFACVLVFLQSETVMAHTPTITVGDEIDGMVLAKGAADATPLWAFCALNVNQNLTTADCQVPLLSKLAIGYVFLGTNNAFGEYEWSNLRWELYLDNQYIDLAQFGTYEYVLPTMAPDPSSVREVFTKFTAWDIVLTNLQPGAHIIEGRIMAQDEEYRWVVNLEIKDQSAPGWESSGQGEKSGGIRLRPPHRENGLSPFHPAGRFYG